MPEAAADPSRRERAAIEVNSPSRRERAATEVTSPRERGAVPPKAASEESQEHQHPDHSAMPEAAAEATSRRERAATEVPSGTSPCLLYTSDAADE